MLTKKQKKLYDFLARYHETHGIMPTYDEMCVALEAKSKGSVQQLIQALEDKGFVRRHKNKARALEIIGSYPAHSPHTTTCGDNTRPTDYYEAIATSHRVNIPYFGEIAAGMPLENIYHDQSLIEVPLNLLGDPAYARIEDFFALKIMGDSMKDAGILDQDTVIFRRTSLARNGDIVAALVDQREITLKQIYFAVNKVTLMPANRDYMPQEFDVERVRVEGQLVNLIRQYQNIGGRT